VAARIDGRSIAHFLGGSWRELRLQAPFDENEARSLAPVLLTGGAGPLAWWRLGAGDFQSKGFPISEFQQAYRISRLTLREKESSASHAVALLREKGIDSIVFKGPVAARLYPDLGLRPYGDVDLAVAPDDYAHARKTIQESVTEGISIDLHRRTRTEAVSSGSLRQPDESFGELDDVPWDEVMSRSVILKLAAGDVRAPSPEHHLRLLCIHFMKHGGFRALWLCDIAAAVERAGPEFDWNLFLKGDAWRTRCALVALQLAGELLGARIDGTPAQSAPPLPAWVAPSVLREWARPERWPGHRPLASSLFRTPWRIPFELVRRLPGALESTVNQGTQFESFPGLAQIGEAAWKIRALVSKL
jgi:Uncharacterised nucleotidyltransferase